MVQVIGQGAVQFFEGAAECPHAPGPEELWQESFVIYTWDVENEVYVFLRIAQTPNRKGGTGCVWLNVWTPEEFYKHTSDSIAFDGSGRTENSLTIGDNLCSYRYEGDHHWALDDREYGVSAQLRFDDYVPGMNYYPSDAGSLIEEAAANHMQTTGWVTGTVSFRGKEYAIAGHGWRDHSFGMRNWLNFRAHRFYQAIFDEDLSFTALSFVGDDGQLFKQGILLREGKLQVVKDFEIVAYMGEDGISNCGGRITLQLDNESGVLEFSPVGKSAINMIHGGQCVDGMCRVLWRSSSGREIQGVGVSETSERAQGGDKTPYVFESSPGVIESGVFPND